MKNATEFAAITALDNIYCEVDNTFSVLQLIIDAFDDDVANLPENDLFAARVPIYQGTLSVIANQLHTVLEAIGVGKTAVYASSEQVPPRKY